MTSRRPRLRLAVRDWDHVTPLVTGRVRAEGVDLDLDLRAVTPDVAAEAGVDGGETSFSRYVRAVAAGDERLVGLPVFLMRGFRHRCMIVRRDSPAGRAADLAGARIGLTGWPDSGNTWTRAILRADGVDLSAIAWEVGPAVPGEPAKDRVGTRPLPPHVREVPPGESLTERLTAGRLDAVFTPFLPDSFFAPGNPLRHLDADHRAAERAYLARTGFVPGIHLLTLRREAVDRDPWLPAAVLDAFTRAKDHWVARRRLLTDTTPWLLAELEDAVAPHGRYAGGDWMPYGVAANAAMTAAFCTELHAQGILDVPLDPAAVFAAYETSERSALCA